MDSEFQSRLICPCLEAAADDSSITPDIPALFRRLLLFETYILQSVRLSEFPRLARRLGVSNVVKLLDSGFLKLELSPNQIAQVGQCEPIRNGKPVLPSGSVEFNIIVVFGGNYNRYLHRCIDDVSRALFGFVSSADLMKLETAIFRALLTHPEPPMAFPMSEALLDMRKELRAGSLVLRRSLSMRLRAARGLEVPDSELDFRVIPISETEFKLESNLNRFGLSDEEAHKIMESACLGVGTLSSRLEEMKTHNALSGCVDHELALFGEKCDLLADILAKGSNRESMRLSLCQREEGLGRVLRVCELPTFDFRPPDRSFDVERFLEVKTSREAFEFRAWLHTAHAASDEEIRDQLCTIRSRLGGFLETTPGRAIRFAFSTALGILADAQIPYAGATVSGLDSFLVDKILRLPGPSIFLSRKYPSVFEDTAKSRSHTSA